MAPSLTLESYRADRPERGRLRARARGRPRADGDGQLRPREADRADDAAARTRDGRGRPRRRPGRARARRGVGVERTGRGQVLRSRKPTSPENRSNARPDPGTGTRRGPVRGSGLAMKQTSPSGSGGLSQQAILRPLPWRLASMSWRGPCGSTSRAGLPTSPHAATTDGRSSRTPEHRDRLVLILQRVVARYSWICHAYVVMDNHLHLLVETPQPNLSLGMRQLNGLYAQWFNRRHNRSGHVFGGRFKSISVGGDAQFLQSARYVVLNPLRTSPAAPVHRLALVQLARQRRASGHVQASSRSMACSGLFDRRPGELHSSATSTSSPRGSRTSLHASLIGGEIYLGDDEFIRSV